MKTFSTIEFDTKKQATRMAELMKFNNESNISFYKIHIKKTTNNKWVVVGTYLE